MSTVNLNGGFTVTGAAQIERFRATVLKQGLKLYLDHGIKANTAYTPKNMVAVAERVTGTKCFGKTWRKRMECALASIEEYLK